MKKNEKQSQLEPLGKAAQVKADVKQEQAEMVAAKMFDVVNNQYSLKKEDQA